MELKPTCTYEYYSPEKGMFECRKPAMFRLGRSKNSSICLKCARILNYRGTLVVAPDGFEYSSLQKVLDKFNIKETHNE